MAATTDYDPDTKGASFLTDTDRLFFLMEEVTRRLRRTFDSSVEQFGLTRTQWRILAYLFRSPGMTQTELARELELERASIGRTIDRLEELELVERRRREERQARLAGSFTPCRNRATSQDASRS